LKYYPIVCLEGLRKTTKTWALLVCETKFEPDCRLRLVCKVKIKQSHYRPG